MTEQPKRGEAEPEAVQPSDTPDEEEGVRRLMRQLLNTPPQKGAKLPSTGRRGRPPKRRQG